MATIQKTEIATPGAMSICHGFALYPAVGSFGYGSISGGSTAGTLFNIQNQSLLLFRFSASAKYEVIFGLCGPAYAVNMNVEGSTTDGTLSLKVEDDDIAAGMTFGLNLGFSCSVSFDQLQLNWVWDGWNSHFQSSWSNIGNWNINIEFDLIDFIWGLIELCMEAMSEDSETSIKKVPTISKSLMSSWGILDERSNTFNSGGGQLFAGPALNLPIDISPMIPGVTELNAALKVFWSHLSFGPQIGFQIPVTVKMSNVTLTQDKIDVVYPTAYDKNSAAQVGTTAGTDPSDPKSITVELDHTSGFDLTFGLFLSLNFLKAFNATTSIAWPILSALGIKINSSPHANNLTTNIGSIGVQACSACGSENEGVFDVIFEPPQGLGSGVY